MVSRATADVPNCPNWSRPAQPEFAASTSSNYGCAPNHNLAMMVANPQDLIVGQAGSPTRDARTVTKAVKSYRDYTPTGSGNAVEKASVKEVKQ